jgi:nitroreductase
MINSQAEREMEFQQVVANRRMVRSFENKPIPPEVVERMLRNALRAPSASNIEGWAFLVLEGADQTGRFFDLTHRETYGVPQLFQAPLVIVCLSSKDAYLDRYAQPDKGWTDRDESRWPVPYWDIDAGMAALLILLTAEDEGLGALFFGMGGPGSALRGATDLTAFCAAYGIPETHRPIGAVAIGYKGKPSAEISQRPSKRRSYEAMVHRGHW